MFKSKLLDYAVCKTILMLVNLTRNQVNDNLKLWGQFFAWKLFENGGAIGVVYY